jgi:uncharacterized protein (TIGR02117 family)
VKSIFNVIKNLVFLIVLAVGMYIMAALVLSLLKTHPQPVNCAERNAVYVSSNGVHIDIMVPVESLNQQFAQQLQLPHGTGIVAFGWGDKDFYIKTPQWKDLTIPTAFRALFLKSETAMHVTAYKQPSPAWRKINICPEQLNLLVDYISNSFAKDAEGNINRIEVKGYANNDSFFDARGSFSLFKTCNIWANQALKVAQTETSVWSPFDFGILYHLPETGEESDEES